MQEQPKVVSGNEESEKLALAGLLNNASTDITALLRPRDDGFVLGQNLKNGMYGKNNGTILFKDGSGALKVMPETAKNLDLLGKSGMQIDSSVAVPALTNNMFFNDKTPDRVNQLFSAATQERVNEDKKVIVDDIKFMTDEGFVKEYGRTKEEVKVKEGLN